MKYKKVMVTWKKNNHPTFIYQLIFIDQLIVLPDQRSTDSTPSRSDEDKEIIKKLFLTIIQPTQKKINLVYQIQKVIATWKKTK